MYASPAGAGSERWVKAHICGMKSENTGMSLVEVDPRFRVTIPKEVRDALNVREGQKLYVVSYGGAFIMKPVPENKGEALDRVIGSFPFDERAGKKAERWLLREASGER